MQTHDFTPSAQQQAIYHETETGSENVVVTARAGTGKTSTILKAIDRAPEAAIVACAFNKRIEEELQSRLSNPRAESKTLHGLGYACVRRYWEKIGLASGNRRAFSLTESVCGGAAPDAIKRLVAKLLTHARELAPHATTPAELFDIAIEFECVPDEEWSDAGFGLEYVQARTLEAMILAADKKPADGIDFADMLYLPVRNKWLIRKYDLVVVDEAQDMNATQLEIAQGLCKGRIFVVGDDRQAIYRFRGADSNSIARLKQELKANEFKLTTTYRCAKAIVREAQTLVPDLEAADSAPEGEIRSIPTIEHLIRQAEAHNFILSRTNAPLAKVAMAMLRARKPVRIQGRDIGAGLKTLAERLMKGPAAHSIPAFLQKLATWETRESERLAAMGKDTNADAIHDKAETLRVITEGAMGPKELSARLDALFTDQGQGQVICSSIHKAKGLEADRVFVLRPTLYPRRKDQPLTGERLKEEENCAYVAITRARKELCYVEDR